MTKLIILIFYLDFVLIKITILLYNHILYNKMKNILIGGKCHTSKNNQNEEKLRKNLMSFRENIIKHWDARGWRKNTKNNTNLIDFSETDERIITHHPVILNILQQDANNYKLEKNNVIWCFYDGTFPFGLADYNYIIPLINSLIELEGYKENTIPKLINEIFNNYGKKINDLQPSLMEIFILQYFIDESNYKKMNELQSINNSNKERWNSYLELFYSENKSDNKFLNFDILGSGHEKDLDERASLIANRCLSDTTIKSIHTMDGHGRFVTRLIKKLMDNNIFDNRPEFNIFVYDLDNETDMWHQITMPLGTAKKGNILNELEKSINDDTINEKLFYINFSGLTITQKQNGGVNSHKSVKSTRKTINKTYKTNSLNNVNISSKRINKKTPKNKTIKLIKPTYTTINQGDNIMELYEKLLQKDKVDRLFVSYANLRNKKYSEKLYHDILLFNENVEDKNKILLLTERSMNKNNELGEFVTVGTQ